MQKEVAMGNFRVLYQRVPGSSEENYAKYDYLVSESSFRLCSYTLQTK